MIRFIFAACGIGFICSVFDTLSDDSDQKQFYYLSSLHAQFYCTFLLINASYDVVSYNNSETAVYGYNPALY